MTSIATANAQIDKPNGATITIKNSASTRDIMDLILRADTDGFEDTDRFAHNFSEKNLQKLWSFVRNKIRYQVDPGNIEMVKRPSVLWALRVGDCKSYSVFIASILYNLGVRYSYRFVAWNKGEDYTHVYVVAHTSSGDIILDSVHDRYDDEVPYYRKKDIKGAYNAKISGIPQPSMKSLILTIALGYAAFRLFTNKKLSI